MTKLSAYLPGLSPLQGKQLQVAFNAGQSSSNGGLLLVREVERELDLAERLAGCVTDRRDPARVIHGVAEMVRFRVLAICAGYEDANDCDALRADPIVKLAVGRLPTGDGDLCSQPTMTRLENSLSRSDLLRLGQAMVDQFCDSWSAVPRTIVLDIDDTWDEVHGGQQLAMFNAHYDGRGFLPVHIYEAGSGKLVAAILRPGRTPTGKEVRTILKHVVTRIRRHWPKVAILIRGDGHYGRPQAMRWCEQNGVSYCFGCAGNKVLARLVQPQVEDAAVRRAGRPDDVKVRRYASIRYRAKRWGGARRVVARIEASARGVDVRYVVTNLLDKPKRLYERIYCARGQMENLIKAHKRHLASDRTSCHGANANQFRLMLHSAAYTLLLALRERAPRASPWRVAQFDRWRLRLIKIGARVSETATRIKVLLPSNCPDQAIFTRLAGSFAQGP